MDAVLMCGGRGTRLDDGDGGPDAAALRDTEKPLVETCEMPMIDRVLAALCDSRVETVYPITSPHVPRTEEHLVARAGGSSFGSPIEIIDAPGDGYVSDLGYALRRVSPPVLTVACDLPLLAPIAVNRTLDRFEACPRSIAVCVPAVLKQCLGTSTDTTWEHGGRELAPTGLNVVAADSGETTKPDRDDTLSMATPGADTPSTATTTDPDDRDTDTDAIHVSYDARLAVNVNRPADLVVAEALCE